MGRVLVLGGSGFIGHHVVKRLLARGEEVSVLVRHGSDISLLENIDVRVVHGDIMQTGDVERALEGADALIHAAGYYPTYSLHPGRQVALALRQIGRIHRAMVVRNVRRFVYVSTLSAVGKYPDGRPEDENAPFPQQRNSSTYALIKRTMQQAVLKQANRFNSVVVAPTGVFGEGDRKPATGRLLIDIAKRKLPVSLAGRLNVVDVRNVAWGIVQALEKGHRRRLYVLGGENITLEGFVARVARIAGVPSPWFALPPDVVLPFAWVSEYVGHLFKMEHPLLPVVGVDFARFGEYYSSEIAKRELGYDPKRSKIEFTLRRAFAWFRQNGYLPSKRFEAAQAV